MPEPAENSINDLDFVRDFYHGMSACADHVEDGLLAKTISAILHSKGLPHQSGQYGVINERLLDRRR